jgi:hypothetical protein
LRIFHGLKKTSVGRMRASLQKRHKPDSCAADPKASTEGPGKEVPHVGGASGSCSAPTGHTEWDVLESVEPDDMREEQLRALVQRDQEVDGISAEEFLMLQEEIEREALERFPGKFDKCTFDLGMRKRDVLLV